MEVGEMFFAPDREKNNLSSYLSVEGPKIGRKFSTCMMYMRKTRDGWVPCEADHPKASYGIGVWRDA